MHTRLQKAEAEAAAVIGLYSGSLAQFGGSTSAPPSGGDFGVSLAWLKSHISMLPEFVGGAIDFGLWLRLTPSPGSFTAEVALTPRRLRRKNSPQLKMLAKLRQAYASLSGTLPVRSGLGLDGLRRRRWWRLAVLRFIFFYYALYGVLLFPLCFKNLLLQELAKKKAKADMAGLSRPTSGVHPSAQADVENPEVGAKAPEGTEAPAPPLPQV